jgi:hypothetical protein
MLTRFEDSELQDVKRSFEMPAVEDSIDAGEENALQDFRIVWAVPIQTFDLRFHWRTSCGLE